MVALKQAFWEIVADCLERFHGYSPRRARLSAWDLRERIASDSQDMPDLFYHREPFYVACDLARHELAMEDYQGEYRALVRKRYEAVEPPRPVQQSPAAVSASL